MIKLCELWINRINTYCYLSTWRIDRHTVREIHNLETKIEFQRKGYATEMFIKAIEFYEQKLISSASSYEYKQRGESSARELTDNGAKWVNKLIQEKIISKKSIFKPF